jgi:fructose-1-phosphate kinase PfkB-like protein
VAAIGPGASDRVELEDGRVFVRPGGAPLYAARALRWAGAACVAIETGHLHSWVRHTHSATEQRLGAMPEPLDPERAHALLPRLAGCEWVLLGGQTGGDFPPDTIQVLAAAGHRVLLDGQGLARGRRGGPVHLGPIDPASYAGVDVLKLNDAEVTAAGPLAPVPELLLSHGPAGASVTVGADVTEVAGSGIGFADPTGAGDSLSALYCLGRTLGQAPQEACRFAVTGVERLYKTY